MAKQLGPFSGPSFKKQVAHNVLPPLVASLSGEITADVRGNVLGSPRDSGRVTAIWLSLGASGKDDSNRLGMSGEVFINGVSCVTTAPSIFHVSGEASQQKTTAITGDTGITHGVVNTAANTFVAGAVFTYNLDVTRTASPTTELMTPVLVVELEPITI